MQRKKPTLQVRAWLGLGIRLELIQASEQKKVTPEVSQGRRAGRQKQQNQVSLSPKGDTLPHGFILNSCGSFFEKAYTNTMEIKEFKYIDAHYSYKRQNTPPSGEVVSNGRILNETNSYLDIEISWSENPEKTYFGIIIPKGFLYSVKKNPTLNFVNGDKVALYWNDLFAYNEEYNEPHEPSSMYTEGIFIKEIDGFVLIDNPETINFFSKKNHPEKKPITYCIPAGAITSIQKI